MGLVTSVVGQNRGVNSAPSALLAAAVQRREPQLLVLSHAIHAEPELAFAEHRSAARVADLVESEGFEVERGVAGLDTAFTAAYGSGLSLIHISEPTRPY